MRRDKELTLQVVAEEMQEETPATEPQAESVNLGMTLRELTPEVAQSYDLERTRGLLVVQVEPGSPSAEAGLISGDIIVEAAQQKVADVDGFKMLLDRNRKESHLVLLVDREGATVYITLPLP